MKVIETHHHLSGFHFFFQKMIEGFVLIKFLIGGHTDNSPQDLSTQETEKEGEHGEKKRLIS